MSKLYAVRTKLPSKLERNKSRHTSPLDLPGSMRPRTEGAGVNSRKVEVQQGPCWTHDPRFQCAPDEQPFGAGFSAAGIGKYLED